ncbi:MAG: DNA mismatch repair protein MutS [Candidatus Omnitrophica bacterium]|nr:DNA mismatch repair protein MutS [Candidatus Omnitrophota bacterium]
MMEQYRSIKKSLPPETILFFRLGDFYEMFFEDAVRASDILNITLTGREGGDAGRVPMCGFPHHAFQGYVRTLLDQNLKVAICEQIGDPAQAKGLVERKVTRVITPATYLDDETPVAARQYLAALYADASSAVMAYLELSTGEFYVREIAPGRIFDELMLLSPREVVVPKALGDGQDLSNFVKESIGAALTVYEDWIFEYDESLRLMTEAFKLGSSKGITFHDHPLAVGACGAVLYYLKDHFHGALEHVQLPRLFNVSQFMMLDRQAQKSLEIVTSLCGRRDCGTLLSVIDRSMTAMGARHLQHWLTHPLLDTGQIHLRQEGISELIRESREMDVLARLLKGVKDVERTLSRLNYGVANARDLVNLRIFLERVPELRNILAKFDAQRVRDLQKFIQPFPKLNELIGRAIVDEPPLGVKEGGLVRDGHSQELDALREIARSGKNWILDFQRREIERTGIKSLKVRYSQVFGYTIEVSKANLNAVPEHYIRRQTLANAERFVVAELKEWDDKISGAQQKIMDLEYQIFGEVREKVLEDLAPLQEMAQAVGTLDALISLARVALEKQWVCPEVGEDRRIVIRGGRHPVVESMLPSGRFVENDTLLDGDKEQLTVLTGPNMAGKSTYIRQTAQIVLLAQMGSFVPARSAQIGLVDRIFTRIGASDDLARGESTFMVEMLETAHILREATDRSLLILDEVGRGTSTFDGVSIAWAICEFLVRGPARPRALFATHYHELTQLEGHFPRIRNYTMTVKETAEGILFLRKVARGAADRSYGIHVAELAGIPSEVTRRAKEILAILESENSEASQIIEFKKTARSKKTPQEGPTLFDAVRLESSVEQELKRVDVDRLTPLEALQKLAALKARLLRKDL